MNKCRFFHLYCIKVSLVCTLFLLSSDSVLARNVSKDTLSSSTINIEISEGYCGICIQELSLWFNDPRFQDYNIICTFHGVNIESAILMRNKNFRYFNGLFHFEIDDQCSKLSEIKISLEHHGQTKVMFLNVDNTEKIKKKLFRLVSKP
jgi:hypothetical protein